MHLFFEKYYLYAFMMDHKKCYYFSSTSGLELAKIIYCHILEGIFNTWNRIQDNWPKHSCSSKLLFPAYYCFLTHFCVQLFTVSSKIYPCSTFHCRQYVVVLCFALPIPLFFAWPLHVRAKTSHYNSRHKPQPIVHSESRSQNLNGEVNWRCYLTEKTVRG